MIRHLYIHRSNRAEALAGALAELLRRPPQDPLRPERLVVQGRGMATWLSQELATRLGIFTNAEFLYPRNVVQHTYAEVLGRQAAHRLSSSNQPLEQREGEQRQAEDPGNRALAPHGADSPGPSGGKLIGALGRAELPLLGAQGQSALLFAVLEALSELAALRSSDSAGSTDSATRSADTADGAAHTSVKLTAADRADLAPLFSYLTGDLDGLRAYQLAERIARCFDQYLLFRPEMMRAFSDAAEGGGAGARQAGHPSLGSTAARWQAALWRRLPAPIREGHIANLEPLFNQRVAELVRSGEPHQLPERLCVFGLSSLPPLYLRTLTTLSQLIEVHLFMLVPSREWFAERAPTRQRAQRAGVDTPELEGHPLLMSLGQLGADLQALVEEHATGYQEPLSLFEDAMTEAAPSRLAALQQSLLDLEPRIPPPGASARLGAEHDPNSVTVHQGLDAASNAQGLGAQGVDVEPKQPTDDSIRIHSCHGPMREVEVLHDTLLDLLARDPTLQPQDIVVMATDIERYAPLFEAVFEEARERTLNPDGSSRPARRSRRFIPYRIADRAAATDAPVLKGLMRLFALAPSRRTASEFMDLLGLAPVAKRFSIEQAELQQLIEWIQRSGIRWGEDERFRAAHGQPALHQNTWRFGLERLLLGYSLPGRGERTFEGCLPYDEVEGHLAELAGKLAEFAETLNEVLAQIAEPRTLADWHLTLSRSLTRLFDATGDYAPEHLRAMAVLDQLGAAADSVGFQRVVPARVMSALLERQLGEAQSAKSFLTGGVTLCAMVPMRSIPRRVVCLLGMDEGAFPRRDEPLPFDLQREAPRRGDRSRLLDDRYLFLEALLSARQHLHLSYTGQSIRDNSALPPSVVIDELLEHLTQAELGQAASAVSVRAELVTLHPLQPFSPRYFEGSSRLFSYRASLARGAAAARRQREAAPPLFSHALPERELPPELRLDQLSRFLTDPGGYLLTQHLGAAPPREGPELADREPLDLDPLARYAVGSELLRLLLLGHTSAECLDLLRASGEVPPGALGEALYGALVAEVEQFEQLFVALTGATAPTTETVSVPIAHGAVTLRGVVSGVYGSRAVHLKFVRPSAKHLLVTWVEHLARCAMAEQAGRSLSGTASAHVSAADPQGEPHARALAAAPGASVSITDAQHQPRTALLITRSKSGHNSAPQQSSFAPVHGAAERLAELHALYVLGSREPLPFFPEAALAWVRTEAMTNTRITPESAAAKALNEAFKHAPHLARLYPAGPHPEQLYDTTGQLSFVELARRVMSPLLQHMMERHAPV